MGTQITGEFLQVAHNVEKLHVGVHCTAAQDIEPQRSIFARLAYRLQLGQPDRVVDRQRLLKIEVIGHVVH